MTIQSQTRPTVMAPIQDLDWTRAPPSNTLLPDFYGSKSWPSVATRLNPRFVAWSERFYWFLLKFSNCPKRTYHRDTLLFFIGTFKPAKMGGNCGGGGSFVFKMNEVSFFGSSKNDSSFENAASTLSSGATFLSSSWLSSKIYSIPFEWSQALGLLLEISRSSTSGVPGLTTLVSTNLIIFL